MKLEDILTLIERLEDSSVNKLIIEEGESYLEIAKEATLVSTQNVTSVAAAPAVQVAQPTLGEQALLQPVANVAEDNSIAYITSPIVGTFYEASNPASPNFVKVGDAVEPGQVVCILEAMKLMNEIESEIAGEILEVMVKNEDMVEYGQKLFKVRLK